MARSLSDAFRYSDPYLDVIDYGGGIMGLNEAVVEPVQNWFQGLNPLDQAAMLTMPVPILGDLTGLAADMRMFYQEPESRTPLNFVLSGAGLLPFVPAVSSIKNVGKTKEVPVDNAKPFGEIENAPTATAKPSRSRDRIGTTGQYVGAPQGVDSPQKLGRIRKNYEEKVLKGEAGRDWYHDASRFINETTPDQRSADEVARILAVTSQGTGVDPNLGFTVKALTNRATDTPVGKGLRFPTQQGKEIENLFGDLYGSDLGYKRQPFAENLSVDWSPELANRPVHDIWQGRALGFTKDGKPWQGGFSSTQHSWMDDQTQLISDRLNASPDNPYNDWDNLRTQAAGWTGEKIDAGTLDIDDAAKQYGDFSGKYEAYPTYEQIPAAGSGHLEGIIGMSDELKKEYSDMATWANDKGQDVLYSDLGLMVAPSVDARGIYTPKTGVTETNPMQISRPLVSLTGTTGKKALDENSLNILDTAEDVRAYIDAQNAGAWNKPILGNQAGRNKDILIRGQVDDEQFKALNRLANEKGMFAIDSGNGVILKNDDQSVIGKSRTGASLGKELKGDFGAQIEDLSGGAGFERADVNAGYRDYEGTWQAGEGSGQATTKLLENLDNNPELAAKLDTPAMREKALANMERDYQFAKEQNLPIREDIQTARKILGKSGFEGLRKALKEGKVLPAVALPIFAAAAASRSWQGESQRENQI